MFMYMKRILISTILLLGMFGIRATAQEFPETEIRRMNLQVLEKIEKLEELSAIDGAVRAEEFMALFRDRKARVYNDLIGVSAESSLPLDEYVSQGLLSKTPVADSPLNLYYFPMLGEGRN